MQHRGGAFLKVTFQWRKQAITCTQGLEGVDCGRGGGAGDREGCHLDEEARTASPKEEREWVKRISAKRIPEEGMARAEALLRQEQARVSDDQRGSWPGWAERMTEGHPTA